MILFFGALPPGASSASPILSELERARNSLVDFIKLRFYNSSGIQS